MMMVLLDEPTLVLFESPSQPPDRLEGVDVLNDLYSVCDDSGQRYVGVITRPTGWFYFRRPEYGYVLRPEGAPDITNALELTDLAGSGRSILIAGMVDWCSTRVQSFLERLGAEPCLIPKP